MSSSDDEKEFRHESYVVVGFSRCTGHTGRLFGSALPNQNSFIRLRITPGLRRHHLASDWYHEDHDTNGGRAYLEVDFSPVQFAELVTTMNGGVGIPCTLRYLNGRQVENPPDELLEVEEVREGFRDTAQKLYKRMDRFRQILDSALEKVPLANKAKELLKREYEQVTQVVRSDMPFVMDQFHEAADKIILHAKAEVDAFVLHATLEAGQKALATAPPVPPTPKLTEGKK